MEQDTTNEATTDNDTPTEPAPKKQRAARSDKGKPLGPRSEAPARREAREAAKARVKLEKELAKEVDRNAGLIAQAEAIGFDLTESDDKIHQLERALGLGSEPEIDEEEAAE